MKFYFLKTKPTKPIVKNKIKTWFHCKALIQRLPRTTSKNIMIAGLVLLWCTLMYIIFCLFADFNALEMGPSGDCFVSYYCFRVFWQRDGCHFALSEKYEERLQPTAHRSLFFRHHLSHLQRDHRRNSFQNRWWA